MPFNNRMTPIRHHYRIPNRGLTGALTLSREVIRAHTHNRRPMFLGEFVGFKFSWDISWSGDVSCVLGVLQGDFI